MKIEQKALLMLLWFSRNQFERRENLISINPLKILMWMWKENRKKKMD